MGFDITFHPVALSEIKTFVIDVINDPAIVESRLALIPGDEGAKKSLREAYAQLRSWEKEVRTSDVFSKTFAFFSAAIAGHLHPYWYARGQALSFDFARRPRHSFSPWSLCELFPTDLSGLTDGSGGLITENYSASGYFPPESFPEIEAYLGRCATDPETCFESEGIEALTCALEYARKNGLGLIEASDIVVPSTGTAYTSRSNLRARFLNHVEPAPKPPFDEAQLNEAVEWLAALGETTLPLLPLRNPDPVDLGTFHTWPVGRQESIAALDAAVKGNRLIALAVQRKPEIVRVSDLGELEPLGKVGYVFECEPLEGGLLRKAVVKIVKNAEIRSIEVGGSYIAALIESKSP